jgi:hypothetical protein
MKRYDLINLLIKEYGYEYYLEIGVENGDCIKEVVCKVKDSVDPYIPNNFDKLSNGYPVTHKMTSDEFFDKVAPQLTYKYDIIFIDGLHLSEQVDKDVENSLKYLNDNGTIILHDCNPANYDIQIVPRIYEYWSGDVWKSVVKLNIYRSDLDVFVIDSDTGLGVIRKNGKKPRIWDSQLSSGIDWEYFDKNRKKLLNLVTENDFIIKFFKDKI